MDLNLKKLGPWFSSLRVSIVSAALLIGSPSSTEIGGNNPESVPTPLLSLLQHALVKQVFLKTVFIQLKRALDI